MEKKVIKEKAVYYKKNGNDLATRNIELIQYLDNVAIDTDKTKIFLKVRGLWYHISPYSSFCLERALQGNSEEFIKKALNNMIDTGEYINKIHTMLWEVLGMDKDIVIKHNEGVLKRREERRKQYEEEERKKEEEKRKREEVERNKRIEDATEALLAGKRIDSEDFILLCKEYCVYLAPRTIYSIRERNIRIGDEGGMFYRIKGKKDPKMTGIYKAFRELKDEIKASKDPEIAKLFIVDHIGENNKLHVKEIK